jgi:transforming growth factor-beta-induced protein
VDALAASPRFDTLVGAVVTEELDGTLAGTNGGAGFTVFAPTNAAFDRLPSGLVTELANSGTLDSVLLYHVMGLQVDSTSAIAADGTSVPTLATENSTPLEIAVDLDANLALFLDGRTQVTFTDIEANNGIIHVIDSVLIPGGGFPGSLVEALSAYPRFDSLVNAVVAENLAGAVTDATVFAPTNDAFANANLGGQPLADVLAYHLLAGEKDSGTLTATETTLLGETISIDTSAGIVINGNSEVTRVDIRTDDGIVHVIDAVLVPGP